MPTYHSSPLCIFNSGSWTRVFKLGKIGNLIGFSSLIFFDNLSRIKNDDKLIKAEGLESLSEAELRDDCRERGMLGILSVEEMRQQVCMTKKLQHRGEYTVT